MSRLRALVLYAEAPDNRTLSYQRGWPRQLARHRRFACELVNLRERSALARVGVATLGRFDAVVALHSVFSNQPELPRGALTLLRAVRAPKALFFGNEYKLMPEKLAFAEGLSVSLVVSQLSSPDAWRLYAERLGCAVVGIPNTGLDPDVFSPRTKREQRTIEIGYRAFDAPWYLGNRERQLLGLDVPRLLAGRGLTLDVSLDPARRFAPAEWAAFLDSCRGQLGSEAGGDFFELTDETRLRVNAYLHEHPDSSFEDVYDSFFRDYPRPVSGRALSGRVVEAAGTKTTQLLLEGEYGGYFRPGEHYVPLRHDLSNLSDAVDHLLDEPAAAEIADRAHDVACSELTYDRLIDRFADALAAVL